MAANTFTGPVVINGGVLSINNADALGSGSKHITNASVFQIVSPLNMAADKTMVMIVGTNIVTMDGAGSSWNGNMILDPGTNSFNITTNNTGSLNPDFAVNGVISGGGVLLKLGVGLLELTNNNTYTGGTRINAGTLSVSTINALGSGTLAFGGGSFRYTGAGTETSGLSITNISAATYDITDSSGVLILNGAISGVGTLTKGGSGTLVYSNIAFRTTGVTVREGLFMLQDSMVTNPGGTMVVGNLAGSQATFVLAGSTILSNMVQLQVGTVAGALGTLIMTNDASYYGQQWVQIGLNAGGRGLFHMTGGSMIITNPGQGLLAGNGAGAVGAIYQTGGDITSYGDIRIGYTGGSYGFYGFAGGSATVSNWTQIPSGGMGLMYVHGGDYTNNLRQNFGIMMGANAGAGSSTGVYYQTGGTMLVNQFRMGSVATNRLEVTIAGGTLVVDETFYINYQTASTNIVNLLEGGTLQAGWINRRQTGGLSFLNFDGGTLRAGTLPGDLFDGISQNYGTVLLGASNRYFTGAYIWDRGAIVDTDGQNVEIRQNLLAPLGNGVTNISLGSGSLTGYLGAPYVAITGGGTGATAVALFDFTSGSVTGIAITSRGTGYTSTPTVTLTGGGQADVGLTALIGANSSTGGLTKTGAGVLTLTGNNTYIGTTLIQEGTLAFGPGSIMTNTVRFELMPNTVLDVTAYDLQLSPQQDLKGSGTVLGNVLAGPGSITPGNSIGTLTITGDLYLYDGVQLNFELNSPSNSDRIIVTNSLSFTDMSTNWFVFSAVGGLEQGDYVLIHSEAGLGWSYLLDGGTNVNNIAGISGWNGYLWLDATDGSGKDVMLTVVPEPGAGTLVGFGLLAMWLLRRRQSRRS